MEPKKHPLLKLDIGKSADIKLLFDDFKDGTSEHGPWYLYGIEVNGIRHNWFPDSACHAAIQAQGCRKGTVLTVTGVSKGVFSIGGATASPLELNQATTPRLEKMVEKIGIMTKETKDSVTALSDAIAVIMEKMESNPFE